MWPVAKKSVTARHESGQEPWTRTASMYTYIHIDMRSYVCKYMSVYITYTHCITRVYTLEFGVWECAQCQKSFVNYWNDVKWYRLYWLELKGLNVDSIDTFDNRIAVFTAYPKFAHVVAIASMNCLLYAYSMVNWSTSLKGDERWSLHLWHFLPSLRATALSSPNHHSTVIIMVHSLYEDQKVQRFLWTS